jgi:hypothetical protein
MVRIILMITWAMATSPVLWVAGVICQRTLSPTFRSFAASPGCSTRSQTKSGAHTTVGRVAPNANTTLPSSAITCRATTLAHPLHRTAGLATWTTYEISTSGDLLCQSGVASGASLVSPIAPAPSSTHRTRGVRCRSATFANSRVVVGVHLGVRGFSRWIISVGFQRYSR